MKKATAILFLILAGCHSGGGSGASSSTCTLAQYQNPFDSAKVQVKSLYTKAEVVPAGTQLVALKKEVCINDGRVTPSGVRSVPFVAPKTMALDELRAQAEADGCVVGLSDRVQMFPSDAYTDPDISQQTHLAAIEQPAANTVFNSPQGINKDVVLAVIDTGVDITHEDLRDNLWVNTKEIPGNGIDDDHNGYVDDINGWNFAQDNNQVSPQCGSGCEHGTHVAGLAAAKGNNGVGGAGVMGEHLKIMALNVFGTNGSAYNSDIDNAIRYAADNGADVINMSLGGGGADSGTQSAIQYTLAKGVTIVVAAGNSSSLVDMGNNFENPASYSGMYPGVLAVASVDTNDFSLSYFSNYGTSVVKIGAPGSDSKNSAGLLSTLPGNAYGRLQGTSMASPVAAGVAALAVGYLKSHGITPTPAAVEAAVVNSGQAVSGLNSQVKSGKVVDLKNLAAYLSANLGKLGCR